MSTRKPLKHGDGVDFQIEGPEATRAIVLHVERRDRNAPQATERDAAAKLEEAVGLAQAIDLEIADAVIAPLAAPKPATLIGSGKVEELAKLVEQTGAGIRFGRGRATPMACTAAG